MAGEWLKFESNLPEKPEVLAITAAMGWDDPDLTVGKLMRLFRWFDQHTVDGNAVSVTPALLDRVIGVTGFVQAVQKSGWIVVADGGISLNHFEYHNGASAKTRAQTAKRVANLRASGSEAEACNAPNVTQALAREEKRREEKKEHTEPSGSVPARKARGQRRCPETFEVSAEMREWARASAPSANVERETMKFRNHEFAKARSDWLATWQNWILKADENAAASPQSRPPPESFRAQEHRIAAERVAEASPRIARRMNPNPTFDYVDMETPDVPRLA
jgi:hypothetical protein